MERRTGIALTLAGGLVVLLAALEFTGRLSGRSHTGAATGAQSGGCAGSPVADLPEEKPVDVRVGTKSLPRPSEPLEGPQDTWIDAIEGEFVLSLSVELNDASHIDAGRLVTGNGPFDTAMETIAAADASKAWSHTPKNEARSAYLGLDRVWRFHSDAPLEEVLDQLEALQEVEWVQPLVAVRAFEAPNDPLYVYQWHLSTMGMPSAWDIADGTDAVVAVVDTGVSKGKDAFDRLLVGYDFVDDDEIAEDEHGHGTHVAGTIAQSTNNDIGVAGMAPGASILPVRVLDANGSGSSVDVADGIVWAVDNGAHIINLSLGANSPMALVEQAVSYAASEGVLVVAAAGNDAYTNFVSYPAAYDGALAISATDLNAEIAYYSNRGPEIALAAPGGDLTVDVDDDGFADGVLQEARLEGTWSYWFLQGTSMATPHVSGLAALLRANGITKIEDLRAALTTTADDLGRPGRDGTYGHGMIDPAAALAWTREEEEEEGVLPLLRLRATTMGAGRALLAWNTNVAALSTIEGDNGYTWSSDVASTVHRALLRGESGSGVNFLVTSKTEDGSARGSKSILVNFQ